MATSTANNKKKKIMFHNSTRVKRSQTTQLPLFDSCGHRKSSETRHHERGRSQSFVYNNECCLTGIEYIKDSGRKSTWEIEREIDSSQFVNSICRHRQTDTVGEERGEEEKEEE